MKLNVTILMLMILLTSYSTTAQTKDHYLLKSKHQKTAAWIMLGGGVGLFLVGTAIVVGEAANSIDGSEHDDGEIASGLLIMLGGASALGSIPLFIAASRNRRHSMNVSITNEPLPALVKNMTGNKYVPSISLRFKF